MIAARILFAAGVVCAALVGFFSPWWFLGFVPLAAGLIWAAYNLVDVEETNADTPPTSRRGSR